MQTAFSLLKYRKNAEHEFANKGKEKANLRSKRKRIRQRANQNKSRSRGKKIGHLFGEADLVPRIEKKQKTATTSPNIFWIPPSLGIVSSSLPTVPNDNKARIQELLRTFTLPERKRIRWRDYEREISDKEKIKNQSNKNIGQDEYYVLPSGQKVLKVYVQNLEVCNQEKYSTPNTFLPNEIILRGTVCSGRTIGILVRSKRSVCFFYIRLKKTETTKEFLTAWNAQRFTYLAQHPIEFVCRLPLIGYHSRLQGEYPVLAKIYCAGLESRRKLVSRIVYQKFAIDKRIQIGKHFKEFFNSHSYLPQSNKRKSGQKGVFQEQEEREEMEIDNININQQENLQVHWFDRLQENEREVLHTGMTTEEMFFLKMIGVKEIEITEEKKKHLGIDELSKVDGSPTEENPRFQVPGWIGIQDPRPWEADWEGMYLNTNKSLLTCSLVCEVDSDNIVAIQPHFIYALSSSSLCRLPLSATYRNQAKSQPKPLRILPSVQPPKVIHIAFDLETRHTSGLKFANAPQERENEVYFIYTSCFHDFDFENPVRDDLVFVLGDPLKPSDIMKRYPAFRNYSKILKLENCLCFNNEFDLLTAFFDICIHLNDPDTFVGHNIKEFDLNFLIKRGEFYQRIGKPNRFAELTFLKGYKLSGNVPKRFFGRHYLDTMLLVKQLLPFRNFDDYKLKTLAQNILPQTFEKKIEEKSSSSSSVVSKAPSTEKSQGNQKNQEDQQSQTSQQNPTQKEDKENKENKNVTQDTFLLVPKQEEEELYQDILGQLEKVNVKKDLPYDVMDAYFARSSICPLYKVLFYIYAQEDTRLPAKIIHRLGLYRLAMEMMKITNVSFHDLMEQGQKARSFNILLMEIEYSHRYINYDYIFDAKVMAEDTFKGGNVVETNPAFWLVPLCIGDFRGLYPSVAQTHKYGYSNFAPEETQQNTARADHYTITATPSPWAGKNFYSVQTPHLEDPLVAVWTRISILRAAEKKKQKKAKENKMDAELEQATMAEQALKISGNALYGALGSMFSLYSRYPLGYKPIPHLITLQGREMQKKARTIMETKYFLSTEAGDTDSVISLFTKQLPQVTLFRDEWKKNVLSYEQLLREKAESKVCPLLPDFKSTVETTAPVEATAMATFAERTSKIIESQKTLQLKIYQTYWNFFKGEVCADVTSQLSSPDIEFEPESIGMCAIFLKKKKYFIRVFDESCLRTQTLGSIKSKGMVNRGLPPFLRSLCQEIVSVLLDTQTEEAKVFGFVGFLFEPQHALALQVHRQKFLKVREIIERVTKALTEGHITPQDLVLTQGYKEGKKSRADYLAKQMIKRQHLVAYGDRISFLKPFKESKKMSSLTEIIRNTLATNKTKKNKSGSGESAKHADFEEATYFLRSLDNTKDIKWAETLDLRWYYTELVKLLTNLLVVPPGLFSSKLLESILNPSWINLAESQANPTQRLRSFLENALEEKKRKPKEKEKQKEKQKEKETNAFALPQTE